MGRLIVSEFVTLDGVMEGPGHDEHRDGKNAWAVTRTVRDLATGTDLTFAPLGAVGLRRVPGEWELFEASTS